MMACKTTSPDGKHQQQKQFFNLKIGGKLQNELTATCPHVCPLKRAVLNKDKYTGYGI